MTDSLALDSFLDKWRARWPEWRVAQVFVPEPQRDIVAAWFSLLQEFTEAAWSGEDATPGIAKLGWWQEELRGWSKGARRHPLGEVLQRHAGEWTLLSAGLPGLQASRELHNNEAGFDQMALRLQPFLRAIAVCETKLFADESFSDRDCGNAVADSVHAVPVVVEHALHHASAETGAGIGPRAQSLLARWPSPSDSMRAARPRRIHEALLRARLQRYADGANVALSSWQSLMRAWRAARGR